MSDKLVLPPHPTRGGGHRPAVAPPRTPGVGGGDPGWVLPSLPPRPEYTPKKQPRVIGRRLVLLAAIGAAVVAAGVVMLTWHPRGQSAPFAMPTSRPAPTITAKVTAVVTQIAPAPPAQTVTAPAPPAVTQTVRVETPTTQAQPTTVTNPPLPTTAQPPPPTAKHWLHATLSASGGDGTFTVQVLVDTDVDTATVDLTITGTHTITKKLSGPVNEPKSFEVTLSPGPGTYEMQAVVHNSSGDVTTRPTSLEV